MNSLAFVFDAKEILQQVHKELITHNADLTTISVEKWKQYILARAVEDIMLVDLAPEFSPSMETMALMIRSNYRRTSGEETFTLIQDVGTHKLFPNLGSGDLSFESQLELHRHCVVISPRKLAPEIQ